MASPAYGMPSKGTAMTPGGGGQPGNNQYGGYGSYSPGNTPWPGAGGVYGGSPLMGGGVMTGAPYYGGNPYQVPQQGGTGAGQPGYYPWGAQDPSRSGAPAQGFTSIAGAQNLGHGLVAPGLQYGGLSQDFANYLMSQVGTGVSPFNLSTMLPTGGQTFPGQLTAPMNPLLSQLANFYSGGTSTAPGANALSTIANQGISALPEWQSMIAAQQQNINQGAANLKEQMGYMGDIAGSPIANAMSQYYQQSQLGQNALLGQLQQQNILQGQIPVAQGLLGGAGQMAGGLQNLDQQAIQNMYNEFIRTSPQYNPMISNIQAMSSMYPPSTYTGTFGNTFSQALAQGLGGFLGNI